MATGIDVRHSKHCRTRDGGKCNCRPGYQAHVYDTPNDERNRKTVSTVSAAKQWRNDAINALRDGDAAALRPTTQTVSDALDALIDGMLDGTVLDRSGRRYRPATVRSYRTASDTY